DVFNLRPLRTKKAQFAIVNDPLAGFRWVRLHRYGELHATVFDVLPDLCDFLGILFSARLVWIRLNIGQLYAHGLTVWLRYRTARWNGFFFKGRKIECHLFNSHVRSNL